MNDQATIRKMQNLRPIGQVVMIRQDELESEVEIQAGKIAKVLLSESMKSMKTEEARQHFLQTEIESILKQAWTIHQCTEFDCVDDGSKGYLLTL